MKFVEIAGIGLTLAALAFAYLQTRMQEEELVMDTIAQAKAGRAPVTQEQVAATNKHFSNIADEIQRKGGYRPTVRMLPDGRVVGGF